MIQSLFFQHPNVADKRSYFILGQLVFERGHFLLALENRLIDMFVGDRFLPCWIGKVARAIEPGLESFGSPIFAVTRGAILKKDSAVILLRLWQGLLRGLCRVRYIDQGGDQH